MTIAKRSLGSTGILVSEIAFGGVEIGMPYGIGVNNRSDMLSHADAIRLLHAAQEGGINFFDTARMYGESETIMGKAFYSRRPEVIFSTKCRHFRNEKGNIPSYGVLRKIIELSLKESFRELQTDYMDIFMLHQADMSILGNEDVIRVFSDLKKSGMIRAAGASTYTVDETQKAIDAGVWNVIQLPFNLLDQRHGALFPLAEKNGIGLVIRSVLMKGLLSSKGTGLHPALKDVEMHIKKYDQLLSTEIPDISTFATKFALSFREVSAVLVGIDRTEYLNKSLLAANGNYLDLTGRSSAQQMSYPDPSFLDLPNWDRMGWLK